MIIKNIKKFITLLWLFPQLIAGTAMAQTYHVQNLVVGGTSTFATRPVFNSNTPYDTGNLTIGNYATLASPTFTGTPVVPGYLTTGTAASTYAPINAPTFTGGVTIPSGASIAGYLTSATAASTYAPLSSPTFSGTVTATTFAGAGTSLTGTATALNIGGNAATATSATTATKLAAGATNQVLVQTAAGTTGFITAPTTASTFLEWNGTAFTWGAGGGGGGSGTVTSVAVSGGTTGLTWTGSPITTSGTFTIGGLLVPANGGTGVASPTAHGVLVAEGSSAMTTATIGTAGNTIVDQGSGTDPKFQSSGQIILTGADPTGATDSTTAIQNAVTTAVVNGERLSIPPGTYKISAAISVPFGTGWTISGNSRGGTIINQTAANTAIFQLAALSGGVGGHSFAFTDMTLQWASAPTLSQTHSIGISFDNSSSTFYDFQIQRLTCNNGYECVGIDSATNTTVWGLSIRDIVVGNTACSAIDFSEGGTGQPNISIDGAYITASSMSNTCAVVNVANNDSGWFNHIEVNAVPNGNTVLYASGQFAIGTIKIEQGTYTNGQYIYRFINAHVTANNLLAEDLTISAGGSEVYGLDINGGGGGTTATIGNYNLTFATGITGDFYLVNSGTAPTFTVRFLNQPNGLIGQTNAFLTQVPASASADGVSVDDWQQKRLTADIGDASTTYAIGNPNMILYNTPLTAARTVEFTDPSNSITDTNLYNGAEVCVVRTAAATGASVITVEQFQAGAIGTTIAAGQSECFMWKRSVTNWVEVSKSSL